MTRMTGIHPCSFVALLALAAAGGLAPAMAAAAPPPTIAVGEPVPGARVTVNYVNPEEFSEARQYGLQDRFNGRSYLEPLKAHLIKRATKMLPAGDRLEVSITDIKLAGGYEPWHGPQLRYVRFMKDVYPPRIDLDFKLTDSNGKVVREGSRKLRNLGYLQSGAARVGDTDPLRYDKALIDSWLRRGPENL
ncbi:DUF3016 domain-containing protein [Rhodanobacter sp. FW102-FHT14D07]|uniref:DUF3016 domain-containing protein n=2 Tax=unclassified Rhodanobacter TaxID=2621553 RepID=A0AB74UU47_9GAMM